MKYLIFIVIFITFNSQSYTQDLNKSIVKINVTSNSWDYTQP
jgi:hypothetical protein